MNQATPQLRNLAKRIIAHEARETKSLGRQSTATFPVWVKLRPPLAALVGSTGAGALLARARALASPEVAWLRTVQIKADGSLEEFDELKSQIGPAQIVEGRVALMSQLLGLLIAFIGESLTMQLVREVWPKLSLNGGHVANGEAYEIRE